MTRVLVVTNDFPPRRGGIESFVRALCDGFDPTDLEVYTAAMPGAAAYDARLGFGVRRDRSGTLLPTPSLTRRLAGIVASEGIESVVFGAAAPLGLMATALRRSGAARIVALTHGHEVWWARTPGTRQALGRIGDRVDTLTYVSEWCRGQLAPALSPGARRRFRRLSPGVDVDRFRPGCGGDEVRRELGIGRDQPVVVCTARLIARKGQDTLIDAWPRVRAAVPGAVLLLVGDGPARRSLQRRAAGLGSAVVFAGSVGWDRMPANTDAGDVFAMPCRTRLRGLEPEAFGIVALEAAACGLPVVVGSSGGAPETVAEGSTGFVVPPRAVDTVATRIESLLRDPETAMAMGAVGRSRVEASSTWEGPRTLLRLLLNVETVQRPGTD